MGVVLANASHIVTAEGVNYFKRMLNTFGSLFGTKGQRRVIVCLRPVWDMEWATFSV